MKIEDRTTTRQLDLDPNMAALIVTESTMALIGDRNKDFTIFLGAILLMAKRNPALFAQIKAAAKEDYAYIYDYMGKIEAQSQ